MSKDGNRVVFLRSSGPDDPTNALWVVDRGCAARRLTDGTDGVVGELTAAEKARRERAREQAGGVVTFVADGSLSTIWFASGGIHEVDVATGAVRALASAADAYDPRPQPHGNRVAYVSGSTVRLSNGTKDAAIPGLDDGPGISWGAAEFVAAEEMGRSRGFWWSPDGTSLAIARVDTSEVESWWIAAPDRPDVAPREIRYPAAGTANANVSLWITDPDAGPVVEVDWAQGEYEYLCDVVWGAQLLLVVQPRNQRATIVLSADPVTGETTEVGRHTDPHWTELFAGTPVDTDGRLITIADDTAVDTRRLHVNGSAVSPAGLQIRSLVDVDDAGVWCTATRAAIDAQLVHVAFDGEVTEHSAPGTFATAVRKGGTTVLSEATPSGPTRWTIRWSDGAEHVIFSYSDEPGFDVSPAFHIAGPRSCNAAVLMPAGHDGSPLPVLLDPYGGPHAQRVLTARNAHATSQWFAEQGFAVVVIDGRGTPGRGPAFEREVHADLAAPVLDDQIDTLQALAASDERLDLSRVGIRGWSFGGYLAALAVLRRPDAVHAAVAGAPVTDWRLYDTHYTERYLGHPATSPGHYEQTDLLADAHRLERPLMLIHGLADDNVVAAHTLTLSSALLAAGRAHEVLPLSGVTHMTPQEQVAENLLHLQRDFLMEHLADVQ